METQNIENKNLEVLGNNQVSSANTLRQTENLALPEIGNNAMTTTEDIQQQETQRLLDKFANKELKLSNYDEVLSKTIFEDTNAKRILGLACVLANTEEEQRNAILTGPSS